MRTWAILLAAGQGRRLKEAAPESKQFLNWRGEPLFWHSLRTLAALPALEGIILVFPENELEKGQQLFSAGQARRALGLPCRIVPGGERRQDSVWKALCALKSLDPACTEVLVHDAARPFASPKLCQRVLAALEAGNPGVVPGVELNDTVKQIDTSGLVLATPERSSLRAVQTPQGFKLAALHAAHVCCRDQGWEVTDDAALLERCALPVLLVPGEAANRKITNPEDLNLLSDNSSSVCQAMPRVGFGYDVHSYGGNRPLVLGGVRIPGSEFMIKAHSDGDVLLHALIDALLGCVGGGDIGTLFPDNNPAFENISSALLLAETLEIVRGRNFTPTQADLTIVAQAPKIAPFRKEIARNVAHLLQLGEEQVNVKATTEEGLGFTGARQGLKAMAMVTGFTTKNGYTGNLP